MPVMGGIMMLLFGSIAGIGLKTIMDGRVNLTNARNLCIVSVTLVTGIGGLGHYVAVSRCRVSACAGACRSAQSGPAERTGG